MAQLSQDRYLAQIEASAVGLAALAGGDLSVPVPTCPEWTLRELVTHVGRAHRWAALISATRSAEFIPFRSVPDGKLPDTGRPAWVTAGAARLTAAVLEAGEAPVWALGTIEPASFWGRRMCHETVMHAADARLATGGAPEIEPDIIEPDIAADAIDEWLTVLSGLTRRQPDPRATALPLGRVLHVHATDTPGEWLVSHDAGGVRVTPGHGKGDVAVTGPAAALLLVLLRRLPAGDPAITVFGDGALLTQWLAATSF